MSEVKFKRPTELMMQFIADTMRDEDVAEVMASGGYIPIDAIAESVRVSSRVSVMCVDNVPMIIIGVRSLNLMAGVGVPWLLSSKHVLKHKRLFINQADALIDEMMDIYPKLVNYVHADNKLSKRWLKRLGFTLDDPVLNLKTGEMFHRFHMEK